MADRMRVARTGPTAIHDARMAALPSRPRDDDAGRLHGWHARDDARRLRRANDSGGWDRVTDCGVRRLAQCLDRGDADLDEIGHSQYPDGWDPNEPFWRIIWWVNQELLHHGAEIA